MTAPASVHIWSGPFLDGRLVLHRDAATPTVFYFTVTSADVEVSGTAQVPDPTSYKPTDLLTAIQNYYLNSILERRNSSNEQIM